MSCAHIIRRVLFPRLYIHILYVYICICVYTKIDETCKKYFSLNERRVHCAAFYMYMPDGRYRDGEKKKLGRRKLAKRGKKIAENFALIAPTVIVLLLSKYVSSQTENCIHYQVYLVRHFFYAATQVFVTFWWISKVLTIALHSALAMVVKEIDPLRVLYAESQFCVCEN